MYLDRSKKQSFICMVNKIYSSLVYLFRRVKEPSSLVAIAYLTDKYKIDFGVVTVIATTLLGFLGFYIKECDPETQI